MKVLSSAAAAGTCAGVETAQSERVTQLWVAPGNGGIAGNLHATGAGRMRGGARGFAGTGDVR